MYCCGQTYGKLPSAPNILCLGDLIICMTRMPCPRTFPPQALTDIVLLIGSYLIHEQSWEIAASFANLS